MSRRSHVTAWDERSKERLLAFQVLYNLAFARNPYLDQVEAAYKDTFAVLSSLSAADDSFLDQTQMAIKALAADRRPDEQSAEPQGFAWELIRGVWDNEKFLDRNIGKYSHNWRLERMGSVVLILLRMALHEISAMRTPGKVVIAEYLSLADSFGAESAKSFMNGIMDAAVKAGQKAGTDAAEKK